MGPKHRVASASCLFVLLAGAFLDMQDDAAAPAWESRLLWALDREDHSVTPGPIVPGPKGGPTACFAPPAPPKRDLPRWREPAPALDAARLERRERRDPAAPPDTTRVLFLLAEFSDAPFDTAGIDTVGLGPHDPEDLLVRYFERQLGYVAEYYADASYGKHVFSPTVLDHVVKLPSPMGYYGDDDLFGERGTKLIWDAVLGADDLVDFEEYSGLAILHSSAGQESDISSNSEDQIWSAFFPQALLAAVMTDSLGREVPGIPTNDVTAEGDTVFVQGSGIIPERESQDGFNFGVMGVYTHELGHVQTGWPDLYDTTGEDPSQGLGAFCLMAAGTWNGNGFVPGEPSEWCRTYAGWLDPVTIDPTELPAEGARFRVKMVEKDHPSPSDTLAIRIPVSADEYFLVTCRQPDPNDNRRFDWTQADTTAGVFSFWRDSFVGAEFDYFTPNIIPSSPRSIYREAEGLYVWHIDESVVRFGFPYNLVNADPHHYGIDLEEADGVQDLEFNVYTLLSFGSPDDAFRAGEAATFSPWTNPSSHGSFGAPTGLVIEDISAPDSVMSFRVRFAEPDEIDEGAALRPGWPVSLPEPVFGQQPLAADLTGDGESEFIVVGENGAIVVLDQSGTLVSPPGLSLGQPPAGSPLVGQVDGDPALELVVVGDGGAVRTFAWSGDALVEETATDLDSLGVVEATLANVRGDAALELVVGSTQPGSSSGGSWWIIEWDVGPSIDSVPAPQPLFGAPVVLSVTGGSVVVQASSEGGMLAAFLPAAGEATIAAPVDTAHTFGPPVAGDLDRDGRPEIVATSASGFVHAWTLSSSDPPRLAAFAGWPVEVGGPAGGTASLADVDDDGRNDVLVVGVSGTMHVLNYNGTEKSGWPKRLDVPQDTYYDLSPPHPAPLAADVTGDGALDLVPVFGDGRVLGLALDPGRPVVLPGWPIDVGPASVPVLGDFDGDGEAEIFAVESSRDVKDEPLWARASLWTLHTPFRARPDAWLMHRRDATRNAAVGASASSVRSTGRALADVYCQPNPGRADGTWIHYVPDIQVTSVEVAVYDASGGEVRVLSGTAFGGVDNLVHWDGRSSDGDRVPGGLYVVRVSAEKSGGRVTELEKLAIVR